MRQGRSGDGIHESMSMSKRSLPPAAATLYSRNPMRSVAFAACAAAPLMVVTLSCVNPEQDYNDYVSRAADAQAPMGAVTVEAGEAAVYTAPDASFDDSTLVMACITTLGFTLQQVLYYAAQIDYSVKGGARTLSLDVVPLPKMATNLSNPITMAEAKATATVSEHGVAAVSLGTTQIPAEANAVSGQAVTLDNSVITIQIESPTTLCGNLGGNIVSPPQALVPSQTPCVFRTTHGGTWTPFVLSDFHCP